MIKERNQNNLILLWALAVLQPASEKEVVNYIKYLLPEYSDAIPSIKETENIFRKWKKEGIIYLVHKKPYLYSMTTLGNVVLPKKWRHEKDKTRLFLLKECRSGRNKMLEGSNKEMVGVTPPKKNEPHTKEPRPACLNESSFESSFESSGLDQTGWTRLPEQLQNTVGLTIGSSNIHLPFFSYPDIRSLKKASGAKITRPDIGIDELSLAIGISKSLILSFTHKPQRHYRYFEIPKKSGGKRQISSPRIFLKTVQYWIADYMLNTLKVHPECFSYQKNKSILDNALCHVNKKYVANVDIENFFGNITIQKIVKTLKDNGIRENQAEIISKLISLNNEIPQGAPTSTIISNAVLYKFDLEISFKLKKIGVNYSRYSDDITFSGDNRNNINLSLKIIELELSKYDFKIKNKKTRIISSGSQQNVTGVVVNHQISPPRKMRRKLRAMVHNAIKEDNWDELNKMKGYVSYFLGYPALKQNKEISRYKKILYNVTK